MAYDSLDMSLKFDPVSQLIRWAMTFSVSFVFTKILFINCGALLYVHVEYIVKRIRFLHPPPPKKKAHKCLEENTRTIVIYIQRLLLK